MKLSTIRSTTAVMNTQYNYYPPRDTLEKVCIFKTEMADMLSNYDDWVRTFEDGSYDYIEIRRVQIDRFPEYYYTEEEVDAWFA